MRLAEGFFLPLLRAESYDLLSGRLRVGSGSAPGGLRVGSGSVFSGRVSNSNMHSEDMIRYHLYYL